MSDIDDDAVAVIPTNKDILFGRGGMTKHHKGNAWFRTLMKENRILYMELPKHHKLQLVEQIVDYILSKKCRFLQKKTNIQQEWYPVSYKRAVVKTSQAFRDAHRYDKTQMAERQHGGGGQGSSLPSLANLIPTTLQEHLIQRSLERYQAAPAASPAQNQRNVVLIPPPPENGEEEENPPRVILTTPKRPDAEYYKKKRPHDVRVEAPTVNQQPIAPINSVAQQMVAIFELAARTKQEEQYAAAAYSARFQAAAQAAAPAFYGQRPVSILTQSPKAPERVSPVDRYHHEEHGYDHEATNMHRQPVKPATPLKNWAALNQVLDRRVEVNEDDQFADAD